MKQIFYFLFVFLVFWFFGFIPTVQAQSVSLSVSPPVVEILLAPNKKVSQTFTLQTTGEDLSITPELHLVKPDGQGGHVTIDPAPLNPSTIPLTITLSGPSTSPTLTFEAASTDISQDVYLALVFMTKATGSPLTNQSLGISGGISALILATITPSGVMPINLEIKDFSLPLVHDSWLPLTITPTLANSTPIMIRPEGIYEIIDPAGITVLSLPLYPNLILGSSSRSLQSMIHDLPSTLTWSPTWKNIGPYRLRLSINTQVGTKLTQVEKVIWILPIRVILVVVLFIIVALALKLSLSRKHSIDNNLKTS